MTDRLSKIGARSDDRRRPNICISTSSGDLKFLADEFVKKLDSAGIVVARESHGSMFAGMELLVPTAIVIYIAHSFFGSMISEAGKDTYRCLKSAVTSLYLKTVKIAIAYIATPGKVDDVSSYFPGFSIVVPTSDQIAFKFLIQPGLTELQSAEAFGAFFDLMVGFITGNVSPELLDRFEKTRVIGRTLLLTYDFSLRIVVAVDPLVGVPGRGDRGVHCPSTAR